MSLTAKELHVKYLKANPDKFISLAIFIALQPFSIGSACCCETHLHAKWSVRDLYNVVTSNKLPVVT